MMLSRASRVAATSLVVLVLVGLNLAEHVWHLGGVWLGLAGAAGLLALARAFGLTWAQLGLGADRLRRGWPWAVAMVGVVGAVYLLALALPDTRAAFLDPRYRMGVDQALLTAFVLIPLRTVLLEEVAFRSVLWGMLRRHMGGVGVLVVSSVLFGLWHVLPALDLAAGRGLAVDPGRRLLSSVLVVAGTVAVTGLGGVVAGELRRRSGSLLASAGMHWATNGLGVLVGLAAWRLTA
jgi:membrane protease YdiL (CAAX protease family)